MRRRAGAGGPAAVELPYDVEFRPTGDSPLALSEQFVRTACPHCGREARRETDTMDTFMCSSWYFMRYTDPNNAEQPFSQEAARAWLPVDLYTGGSEHAVMHLLYARFFYKAARDAGIVPGDEPFTRYFSQGQILGPDGRRMSKSRGNVVAPDSQVERWGADTFRAYLMFLGPWEQGGPYDVDGIVGVSRWLQRVWTLVVQRPETVDEPEGESARELRRLAHRTAQRVTDHLGRFRLNTMIAALMEMTNGMQSFRQVAGRDARPIDGAAWDDAVELLLLMLAPPCPHIAEELWERTGRRAAGDGGACTSSHGRRRTPSWRAARRWRSRYRSTAGCATVSRRRPAPARRRCGPRPSANRRLRSNSPARRYSG